MFELTQLGNGGVGIQTQARFRALLLPSTSHPRFPAAYTPGLRSHGLINRVESRFPPSPAA